MPEIEKVLNEAEKRLKENPTDAGHDYDHHVSVVLNCQTIISKEKITQIDINALRIAASWHDYLRGDESKNDQILTSIMEEAGYKRDYIDKVLSIKNSHTYGVSQQNLEAKVLFDADKLEYLSTRRYSRITNAVQSGEMSMETLAKYKKAFRERIGNIRDQLHFEISKSIFDKRMQDVIAYTQRPGNVLWSDLLQVV